MKFNKSEMRMAEDVFGTFTGRLITTDAENIRVGDEVTLVNSNCEFSFDNVFGVFQSDLSYEYIVDLELVETNYSQFVPEKSNNGGAYAFATCKVTNVIQ